jgi:predicted nucleotidyltransferase component of viral defense system
MYLYQHKDFIDFLNSTAKNLKMPVAFVEKDYWITYALYRLKKAKVDDFIFKGGTSLTKGWNLLERFSEDIDLLFVPHNLSKDRKRGRLKKVQETVMTFEGLTFDSEESSSKGHYRTDCYRYEIKDEGGIGPLLPYIKLEMGYRGGDHPTNMKAIQSYVGTELEKVGQVKIAEDVPSFEVKILDHRRTFVEKIFAIYSAYENKEVTKYFRHYYDVYKLLQIPEVQSFLGTKEYRELKNHVQEMSREFFSTQFPENLEFSTSEAFSGRPELIGILDKAIDRGKGLFFVSPPNAKAILAAISKAKSFL